MDTLSKLDPSSFRTHGPPDQTRILVPPPVTAYLESMSVYGRLTLATWIAAVLPACGASSPGAHSPEQVFLAMRDGVLLATDLWFPRSDRPYPTVLLRTPYGKSEDLFYRYELQALVADGYAVVLQDTRGTGRSGGTFNFYFPEGEDGYDTIGWIADQPWSDGRVAMDGGSYLGTVQWLAAVQAPPALKCIIPTAPSGDLFNELPYVGGAFHFGWALQWIRAQYTDDPEPSAERWAQVAAHRPLRTMDEEVGGPFPLYRDILDHPTLDDFWEPLHIDADEIGAVDIPALTVTGWYDGDQAGALHYWRQMHADGQRPPGRHLIIGPWVHAGTYLGGSTEQGRFDLAPQSVLGTRRLRHQFLDYCLKEERVDPGLPRVLVYLTGSDRWLEFDDYPPPGTVARRLFLSSGGSANTALGDGALLPSPSAVTQSDAYAFDPQDPVMGSEAGADRSAAEARGDVLVFTTQPLQESWDVLGPVSVVIHASSDVTDTDFTAKLIDVYPDGTPIAVNHNRGVIRARFRDGFDRERLMKPDSIYRFEIGLSDVGHTFLAGHRLRIEVSSSDFPYVNPNQNTGNPVATDTEWRVAEQRIYHGAGYPSHVVLPILIPDEQ